MIVTVTPNPAIDQIYWVASLPDPREALLVRAAKTLMVSGGKGLNVSLLLGRLGVETMAMGIIAGAGGRLIEHLLHEAQVTTNFVWTEGESRTNVTVVERGREVHPLEVNAAGPPVSPEARARFLRRYGNALKRCSYAVLGGSLPPGLEAGFYETLIRQAQAQGVKTVLNASGRPHALASALGPWINKPDIRETPEVLGQPVRTLSEAHAAGRELLQTGSEIALIGHDPAQPVAHQLVVTRQGAWDYRATEVRMSNRLGAGDAFVGGFLYQLRRDRGVREAGRYGMAAAVASAESDQPITASRRDIERALARVKEVAL